MPRKKGSPNKVTSEVKELMSSLMSSELHQMQTALEEVRNVDAYKYLQIMSKLLAFVLPKAVEEHTLTINSPTHPPSWFNETEEVKEDTV